jgi:thiol-disulfide isomerase/thioredoxin
MGTAMLGVRAMAQGASWSGKERNRLFMNAGGSAFDNPSGISGLDAIADGRSFAHLDVDRDGWSDVALVNTNAPRFELFRNGLGDDASGPAPVLALRLRGGNRTSQASADWSARDGYGASIHVRVGDRDLHRELRCGEGLSAQNSDTLLIGLGAHGQADSVRVRWPSGREQTLTDVPVGTQLTIHEDPRQSPTGAAFVASAYGPGVPLPEPAPAAARARLDFLADADGPAVRVHTTTATWCANCAAELPIFEELAERFAGDGLGLYGVPYDDRESADDHAAYRARHEPAYSLLQDLDADERLAVRELLEQQLGGPGLPASVVTDAAGQVLLTTWGLPSVSQLADLLVERR